MKKLNDDQAYEQLINVCQLPKDVFLGASIISMTGNRELHIENFKNIIRYLPEQILIQCHKQKLLIVGRHLGIAFYSKEEMKIIGEILEIKFI